MKTSEFQAYYNQDNRTGIIVNRLETLEKYRLWLRGLVGSSSSLILSSVFQQYPEIHLVILPDKESSTYFFNDLESIFEEIEKPFHKRKVLFFPTSYKRHYEIEKADNTNLLFRTEILKRISSRGNNTIIVSYPEAITEKVITRAYLKKNTLKLSKNESVSMDFVIELLQEYQFDLVDFVVEPGQFAIRGGLIDVFSFSNDHPFRIEFHGDEVENIRSFNPETQLSVDKLSHITILPNVQDRILHEKRESFFDYISSKTILWIEDIQLTTDKISEEFEKAEKTFENLEGEVKNLKPKELFITSHEFTNKLIDFSIIEFGKKSVLNLGETIEYKIAPQPSFNKNFDLLIQTFRNNTIQGVTNIILTENPNQIERIYTIIDDLQSGRDDEEKAKFTPMLLSLHEGFMDKDLKIACYTDHQIFERFHKFRLKDSFRSKEAFTLKEIYDLQPGDFVTHIDHGIGRFAGLEKIDNNGKQQEAMRLVYLNNDILYVSIHSLHRISKYVGKDGVAPKLDKLGSNAWLKLKLKTKQRVKDIAKDLIKLYSERKASLGFQFMPDTYLQHELEASFIYEDTPDQIKATVDVKKDMESSSPMDRLVCGDVGFGKTEIAIRAAFKAVNDSKQVAVLVPTTILALQHYKTFKDRLKDFPCKVDYINRFKSSKDQKETLKKLASGEIDILIGTHRLLSKDIIFKDMGLLIVDEEQKFGVSSKEKLKQIMVEVDTLTLTATPIPRTLQFSMMGARDLTIINTPPPNRYPVQTELHTYNSELIRNAINYEVSRGGQVFFLHNRVKNIKEVALSVSKLCPDVRIAIGHGQLDGKELEQIMLDFIDGEYDVLIATTIIESGLDIPNANTIIINEAHHYGLSDLHQLRGRVGRTNKKAFCYLIAPPTSVLTQEARKRLKAIEEFSDLGSGFNIAMRDLDIRGAGNILGAEQSGFISDIGFEMYQKILDEAILELKQNEFKHLYKEETSQDFVKECVIETDLEILIPDDYINSITERLSLYKELDMVEHSANLDKFKSRLEDRFGIIPPQVLELLNTIRLRWLAKKLGFEKIILKQNRMIASFVSNPESPYYQSPLFTELLKFIQQNPANCKMKEHNEKLTLTILNINSVEEALYFLKTVENDSL